MDSKQHCLDLLRTMLGPGSDFRPGQWEAIEAVAIRRQQVLVVQRTGWGKSLVYFLAARLLREAGAAFTLPRYAQLPSEGLVDTLPMRTAVDLVGYGVQFDQGGGPRYPEDGAFTRFYAPTQLVASNHVHSDEYIKLTANPAQGKGGTCFGDSGGPDLLGGTDIILAVNSYVTNGNCAGVTYSNRIDTYALDFINSFLP